MDMPKLFTIGDVAKLFHLSVSSLRHYEDMGLLEPEYKTYQAQVKANAAAMAKAFMDKGYKIISDGTDNHSMLIDLRKKFPELTGKVAEKALVAADITVNIPLRSAIRTV